jgi:hypothetical protein
MSNALQLDEVRIIELHDAPKLLVEWSPRWEEFVTSIKPALARSGPRLAGEAPHGGFPYRGMAAALVLESFLLVLVGVLPREVASLRPYAASKLRPDEIIYYSGDELPRTQDLGGAESGRTGRAGGREAHHRTQTIHVARGSSLANQIVDAPDLKLHSSPGAVANLLAFKSIPGPPPSEGLHSSLTAPRLPANVVAPAPTNVTRAQSRNGVTLDAVVPPAPTALVSKSRTAPELNAAVVPPTPTVQSEHPLFAPRLDPSIIAPAPKVSRDRSRTAPTLNANVIGPASTRISQDRVRSAPTLNANIVPPAPTTDAREVAPTRVQMNAAVVPPPVSSPEREIGRNAKLNMPAPAVVAPPPSADSSHDLRRLESGTLASSPTVVPPAPTQAANTGFVSSIIGKLFGTQDVVPPPPTASASGTARSGQGNSGVTLAANVIPPPPSASGGGTGTSTGSSRRNSITSNVVPPPPSVNGSDTGSATGTGSARGVSSTGASIGTAVVPPPPSVTGSGSGNGGGGRSGTSAGMEDGLGDNVVQPPPSMGSGSGLSGSGRKGIGQGGIGDLGSVLALPKGGGGTSDNSGVVLSAQPGSSVGRPGSGGKGALAMSPGGGDQPGLGGSGGGSGIGRGDGPGSGLTGENSGAGKSGTARGSDANARGGISPTPGPGGAGTALSGNPAVPGVDVRGGSTIVTLPSFGSDGGGNAPSLPGRSSVKQQQGPAITIVATSRSGGAFDFYGKLPGDNYTVYVDTQIGTAVMQFAELNPSAHSQAGSLTGPAGIRTNLPADLPRARVVVKCELDASGNLRNLQVLEPGPAAMTARIMAALPSWKFRPATRGTQPVEVNAILGFNIDTNDRN